MAALASTITVKKVDGVTDVVWNALQGANGRDPLVLRQDTGQPTGLPVGLRPTFRGWQKSLGDGTSRVINTRTDWPYAVLNSSTNAYERRKSGSVTVEVNMPGDIPPDQIAEMVYQTFRILVGTASSQPGMGTISTGYLPT